MTTNLFYHWSIESLLSFWLNKNGSYVTQIMDGGRLRNIVGLLICHLLQRYSFGISSKETWTRQLLCLHCWRKKLYSSFHTMPDCSSNLRYISQVWQVLSRFYLMLRQWMFAQFTQVDRKTKTGSFPLSEILGIASILGYMQCFCIWW